MRASLSAIAAAWLLLSAAAVRAQVPDTSRRAARDTARHERGLPRVVQREVVALYNAAAVRAAGRMEVDSGRTVAGDLGVLRGPVMLSGRVDGRVIAVNADVILRPDARVQGDLVVVGGEVEGLRPGMVRGEVRVYRDRLPYLVEGDRLSLSAEDEDEVDEREPLDWWRRWERRRARTRSRIHVGSAGAYNRVEGLPINIGPSLRQNVGDARLQLDAFAVLRTETSFQADSSDVGYDMTLELRPRQRGVAIGGRMFDVTAPVEAWHLSELEAGLASFLVRRDYRDYGSRRGGSGYVSLVDRYWGELSVGYAHERWGARRDATPWTLFRGDGSWRPNPLLDDARLHLVTLSGRLDTRNDRVDPRDGWLVIADVERGTGDVLRLGATAPGVRAAPAAGVAPVTYTRGFVDVRKYSRISPHAQLNLRGVLGGWLGGDELPLQRRLSVDGPGAVPGFGFRRPRGLESGICAPNAPGASGLPAQCERIALAQAELRGDLHVDLISDAYDWRLRDDVAWVAFVDAGRGWLVRRDARETQGYTRSSLPPFASFRTDVGLGLDLGFVGLYVAKAVSHGGEPPVAHLRLRRRF